MFLVRFRVVTSNLMAPAGPFLSWKGRAEGLARFLERESPHLIGVQEATEQSLESFKAFFPHHTVLGRGRWANGEGIQCAVLISKDKFSVNDYGHFWMSRQPNRPGSKLPGMGSARVATWVTLTSDGERLTWLNLHFSHLCRRHQARIVLNQLSSLPRPWLVTGDFNGTSWPRWSSHRILGTKLQDLGADAGATWNARIGLPLARLDWVLGSAELRALNSKVLRVGESDHWPLMVDVEMGSASSSWFTQCVSV